jgi:hypothetical protein
MGTVLPGRLRVTSKMEPRLVHEGSRLKRVTRRFAGHSLRCERAQFLIDHRHQFLRGAGIALLCRVEDLGNITHNAGRYRPPAQCRGPSVSIRAKAFPPRQRLRRFG